MLRASCCRYIKTYLDILLDGVLEGTFNQVRRGAARRGLVWCNAALEQRSTACRLRLDAPARLAQACCGHVIKIMPGSGSRHSVST